MKWDLKILKSYLYRKITNLTLRREGNIIPKGWGIAYWKFNQAVVVIMPIPFNFIVGWIRKFYFRLVSGPGTQKFEMLLMDAERRGYDRAYKQIEIHENRMLEQYRIALKEQNETRINS